MIGKIRERKNTIEKTAVKIIPLILPLFLFYRSMRKRYKFVKMVGNVFC